MKQRDLIKKLEDAGFFFEGHGGNHDIYRSGNDIEKVPRHKEVIDFSMGVLTYVGVDFSEYRKKLTQRQLEEM